MGRFFGFLFGPLFEAFLLSGSAPDPGPDPTPSTPTHGWTSADLLRRFLSRLGRGNGGVMQRDELWTAARGWEILADAQEKVYADLSPIVPRVFISQPIALTTADGGVTYNFPTYPFGHVEVYAREDGGRALFGSSYNNWSGDFVFEGSRLRATGNRSARLARGVWARFSGFPIRMGADVEPSLDPPPARDLILQQALIDACDIPGAQLDPSPFQAKYAEARRRYLTLWQTQSKGQRPIAHGEAWWAGLDQWNQ